MSKNKKKLTLCGGIIAAVAGGMLISMILIFVTAKLIQSEILKTHTSRYLVAGILLISFFISSIITKKFSREIEKTTAMLSAAIVIIMIMIASAIDGKGNVQFGIISAVCASAGCVTPLYITKSIKRKRKRK